MRPPADTGGAVTWNVRPPFLPKPRFQAISKALPASTCSIDCSAVPPGRRHSVWTTGSGRKKSAPFSDSLASTFWSKAMIEIRWPWLAVLLFLSSLLNGLSLETVEQPLTATEADISATRATERLDIIRRLIGRRW